MKRSSLIPNLNPKTIFNVLVSLTLIWMISRPLKSIGLNVYFYLGGVVSNAFQGIVQTKSSAEELLKAKAIVEKQSAIISNLKTKLYSYQDEVKEIEKLKKLLDLKKNINYKTVTAKTIGRSPDNWHKQIILDKGLNVNIMIGDAVLTNYGVVGQVVEVTSRTSIVQLVTDSSFKLGCRIAKKNILGILSNKDNSTGLLEFVPIGSDVMLKDLVVTSGLITKNLLPSYPSGHPVGRIKKISKKASRASDLYIEVKLLEDLNSIDNVLVFSPGM